MQRLSFSLLRAGSALTARSAAAQTTFLRALAHKARVQNVGIHAMDIYFPSTYVSQTALEAHDGVSAGKYTKGLGLNNMAFCNDREDINSVCLTAVANFMEKFKINPKDIGRLEVGTETLIDKSKAVKTVLMQLFAESGNTNMEGVDNVNACYGGTAALLNSAAWVESSGWDGRYALVVCGDIAVYEKGNARPTGGAGVTVMLVGPEAPVALDASTRASHFEHAYDFYKPNMSSEYPVVDGQLSIGCYLRALDRCYNGYMSRVEAQTGKTFDFRANADYTLFHSPFVKMTRKAYNRLGLLELRRNPDAFPAALRKFATMDNEKSYADRELDNALTAELSAGYDRQVVPTALFAAELGNSYTASLYASLVATLMHDAEAPRKLLMFSYGSGLAATMFSLSVRKPTADVVMRDDIRKRLAARKAVEPADYEKMLAQREKKGLQGSVDQLFPGTFYLKEVDSMQRRYYARK